MLVNPQEPSLYVYLRLTAIVSIALCLHGCGLFGESDLDATGEITPKRHVKRQIEGIGKIASINKLDKFVLIDVKKPKLAKKAAAYYVERRSRQAQLRPTGEQIGSYMAADIVSGSVELGDSVLVKLPKPAEPEVTEEKQEIVEAAVEAPIEPEHTEVVTAEAASPAQGSAENGSEVTAEVEESIQATVTPAELPTEITEIKPAQVNVASPVVSPLDTNATPLNESNLVPPKE